MKSEPAAAVSPKPRLKMQNSTLLSFTPRPGITTNPASLRALLRLASLVRRTPGFRSWRSFRAMNPTNALHVVIDWDCESDPSALFSPALVERIRQESVHLGFDTDGPKPLQTAFDRGFLDKRTSASLLRLTSCAAPDDDRESRFALRALAMPGVVRMVGSTESAGENRLCRIEFDSEDSLWSFRDGRLCTEWTGDTDWAINLPRLEFHNPSLDLSLRGLTAPEVKGLSVQMQFSHNGRTARMRLQGIVDKRGTAHCERLCRHLSTDVLRLEIDVSGLAAVPADTLAVLAGAARTIKSRGGAFVLIDNEARVRQVTRTKGLEAAVN